MSESLTLTDRPQTLTPAEALPEALINDNPREFTEADFPVGTISAQGDLYIVRLAGLPEGATPRADRQLAIGNTQGSRHVLVGETGLWNVPAAQFRQALVEAVGKKASVQLANLHPRYIGPVFEGGCVTHPEHGHQTFQKGMVCGVVYQRNLDAEEQEQRVAD